MQVKATHHIALLTRNFAEMEKFYSETLGFAITKRWDDIPIIFIDIGSSTIELIGKDRGPAARRSSRGARPDPARSPC